MASVYLLTVVLTGSFPLEGKIKFFFSFSQNFGLKSFEFIIVNRP